MTGCNGGRGGGGGGGEPFTTFFLFFRTVPLGDYNFFFGVNFVRVNFNACVLVKYINCFVRGGEVVGLFLVGFVVRNGSPLGGWFDGW